MRSCEAENVFSCLIASLRTSWKIKREAVEITETKVIKIGKPYFISSQLHCSTVVITLVKDQHSSRYFHRNQNNAVVTVHVK